MTDAGNALQMEVYRWWSTMNADDQDLPSMEDLSQKVQTLRQQRDALLTDVSWLVIIWLSYSSEHLLNHRRRSRPESVLYSI